MFQKNTAYLFLILFLPVLFSNGVFAALNVSLSNQGTGVILKSTDELLTTGDIEITVWNSSTGGNPIYNETFIDAITDGYWNVMIGENSSHPLPLEFGETYYIDYKINGEDVNFTNLAGLEVDRQFFYSPLGEISDEDISDSTNLTLGQRISFAFGEVIDNIVDEWIRITGGLNVTDNVSADFFIGDGSLLTGIPTANQSFSAIVGFTNSSYDGNITNGTLIGYVAANSICNAEYSGSHFCLKSEILKTISNGNYSFSGTAWFQNGPPGFTANSDDCSGWTTNDNTFLGPFWNWGANSQAGKGVLTNCAQVKQLMCCGGNG